jgi:hypothetical protein
MSKKHLWLQSLLGLVLLFGAITSATAAQSTYQPPTISGSPPTSATVGVLYSFTPTTTDPSGGWLTFSIANRPSWMNFNTSNGRLQGTPAAMHAGTYPNIIISVSDGTTKVSLPAFTLQISTASNGAPTISGSPATTVQAGSAYSFTPKVTGQNLTFSITNKPAWATLNTSTGALTGTPNASQVGTTSGIVISVKNTAGSSSLPAFSITVTSASPTISGTPGTTATVGTAYSFTPTTTNPSGGTLAFSITSQPSWASFSATTGRLQGTPTSSNVGTNSNIVISVSDGKTKVSLPAFSITVASNGAPTISGSPATTVQAGSAYSFTPTVSGQNLTFSITNKPAWATLDTSTGALTGTPNTSQVGTTSGIVISVKNAAGTSSLAAFSITVTAPGTGTGTATLQWNAPTQNANGSALTNLAGYKVYHGTSATALTDVRTLSSPGITTYVFDQLPTGTHYFAVSAVNSAGAESDRTTAQSKTIR